MQVEIEVKVRDTIEQKFIEDVTAAVEAFAIKHNRPDIKRLCFARKSSYAGCRASDYHLRAKRTDHNDKELWVNIKECSTSLNDLFKYVARALYWWDCKDKAISKKTVSEDQYVTAMLGVQVAPTVAAPVVTPARVQAAAPKKAKKVDSVIVDDCTYKLTPTVKKTENAFMDRFMRVVQAANATPNVLANVHTVEIKKLKKSARYGYHPKDEGVDFTFMRGERSGRGIATGTSKIHNTMWVTFSDFSDETFGYAVSKVVTNLGFKLNAADRPDPVDVLAAVLRDGSRTEDAHRVIIACNKYATRILGE